MKTRLLIATICAIALSATLSLSAADKKKKDPLAGIKCPVSGKPIKAASFAKHNGGKVYFCCDNCPKAFAKSTDKYAAKANQQLYATKQAKLEKCPITGKKLNTKTAYAAERRYCSFRTTASESARKSSSQAHWCSPARTSL